MPKYYYDVLQNSEEWDDLHVGRPTASEFSRVITAKGKQSTAWRDYGDLLIAERILKRQVDFSMADSPNLDRGHELEPEAVLDYEAQENVTTKRVGFVTNDAGTYGCSPDRLVGDFGLLEVKCPKPNTQIRYLLRRQVEDEYKPQLQGQLLVTGRKWVDIYAYHPELPRAIVRVERDEVYIRCLEQLLTDLNTYIENGIIEVAARMTELRATPDMIRKLLGEE